MMKNRKIFLILTIIFTIAVVSFVATAQNDFAATLEVLNAGVQVQRVNTANFIAVEVEAIVGVGDMIVTDETGEARITFFADGTDVTLEANTEYRIIEFQGDDDDFQLTVEVLAGQTTHRLNRALGANSSYDVETPGMTLAAQGTVFAIRVEDGGRSGLLVFEGNVDAGADENAADVPAEFAIRSEVNSDLSDVVRASTFSELDSALDGCSVSISTVDDVSINVRLGPSLDQSRIGIIDAEEIDILFGISADNTWYRVAFKDNFGWILSTTATVQSGCAGLRVFEDTHFEDASLYNDLDEGITITTPVAVEEPEATEEAGE